LKITNTAKAMSTDDTYFDTVPLGSFRLVNSRKWLGNHPWIFLFQNLSDNTALHDPIRMKWSVCHSTGVNLVA